MTPEEIQQARKLAEQWADGFVALRLTSTDLNGA
jgi:hypothetical protein